MYSYQLYIFNYSIRRRYTLVTLRATVYRKFKQSHLALEMIININSIVERLQLQPHPEGGYYRETHRSPLRIAVPYANQTRSAMSSIYFLLHSTAAISHLHRIQQEELWVYHEGTDELVVVEIHKAADGNLLYTRSIITTCN
jgi:hypothetical protein